MSIKERKQREKEALREKILSASMKIIEESGVEGFSIRTLAAEIDYSPRTIYLYFRNKEAILQELVDYQFGITLKALDSVGAIGGGVDKRAFLRQSTENHIRKGMESPHAYKLIIHLLSTGGYTPGENEIILKERVKKLLFSGEQKTPEEADSLIMIIFSTLRGFTLELINNRPVLTEDEMERRIVDYIDFMTIAVLGHEGEGRR